AAVASRRSFPEHGAEGAAAVYCRCVRQHNFALKIRPCWLGQILREEKRLEIRRCRCARPEQVTRMETGTLLLRARARITESHLVTDAEMVENHQALDYAWILTGVEILDPPFRVPSIVARRCVTWMLRARWKAWDEGHLRTPATITDFFAAGRTSSAGPSASSRSWIRSFPGDRDGAAES
ncbi:unnamed protein product, partial [Symbiodinium pilosum]